MARLGCYHPEISIYLELVMNILVHIQRFRNEGLELEFAIASRTY